MSFFFFFETWRYICIFYDFSTLRWCRDLTHWGRVTHICISKLTIIGSDNGLLPSRHQAIGWTSAGVLLIGPLRTSFSEILSEIHIFSLKNGSNFVPARGGWGCEISCGGHHRQRGKTTMGSALDEAALDFTQILAYLVHNMSRSQLYLGFGHFGWVFSYNDLST